MARACASAWTRVILPSRVPYAQADAPLGGSKRRKAEARQNARRSRVPDVGDDERARPLMERAEGIAFVELSDGHNELFRSVVQSLLSDMTTRRTKRCSAPRSDIRRLHFRP
jgi:hypothetical protein